MSIIDKLLKKREEFANDGSQEMIDYYIEAIEDEGDVEALLANCAFQKMLESMRSDFKARMREMVETDDRLWAIKSVFLRTLGKRGAEEQIESMLDDFLDEGEEMSEPLTI